MDDKRVMVLLLRTLAELKAGQDVLLQMAASDLARRTNKDFHEVLDGMKSELEKAFAKHDARLQKMCEDLDGPPTSQN